MHLQSFTNFSVFYKFTSSDILLVLKYSWAILYFKIHPMFSITSSKNLPSFKSGKTLYFFTQHRQYPFQSIDLVLNFCNHIWTHELRKYL